MAASELSVFSMRRHPTGETKVCLVSTTALVLRGQILVLNTVSSSFRVYFVILSLLLPLIGECWFSLKNGINKANPGKLVPVRVSLCPINGLRMTFGLPRTSATIMSCQSVIKMCQHPFHSELEASNISVKPTPELIKLTFTKLPAFI